LVPTFHLLRKILVTPLRIIIYKTLKDTVKSLESILLRFCLYLWLCFLKKKLKLIF
jgi:hypothetical protein